MVLACRVTTLLTTTLQVSIYLIFLYLTGSPKENKNKEKTREMIDSLFFEQTMNDLDSGAFPPRALMNANRFPSRSSTGVGCFCFLSKIQDMRQTGHTQHDLYCAQ